MAYGVRYRGEWRSPMRGKRNYIVEIAEDGYTGTSVKPLLFTGDVLTIAYGERDDSELKPIKSSECELTILCTEDGNPYTSLYTLDPWKYKLSISENTGTSLKPIWQGYLATGDYSQPIAKAPYSLRIRANDGLGLLKTIDYLQDGEMYNSTLSIRELLIRLLSPISESMGISIWPANKVYGIQAGDTFDIIGIADSSIYTALGDGTPTYYDVLEAMLECFGLQLFQENNGWQVRSIDRLSSAVRSSRIRPISMSIDTNGLGLSSAGTLSMLPPVNSLSSQSTNEASVALGSLLNLKAWQFSGLGNIGLPKIANYSKDSILVHLPSIALSGLTASAVNILPNTIHLSETTEIDVSFDVYNARSSESNIAIGVWLIEASVGNAQLITTKLTEGAARTTLSVPCYAPNEDGWARVPSGAVLSPSSLYFQQVKLNKGKISGGRPALARLEKQSVNITLPSIPQMLNGNYYIRDWRIAIVLAKVDYAQATFYLSSPKVTVKSTKENNVADKIAIAGEGIDTMSTSSMYDTIADSPALTSLSPQLINVADGSMLYGYMVPALGKSSLENKAAIVKSLRADTTIELEGVVDKRNGASLNNVWLVDGKYFYATYLKYQLRSDLIDIQLRELYALNASRQSGAMATAIPTTMPFDVGRTLYHVVSGKLYAFDSITVRSTLIEDLASYQHYEWKGVDCFVVVKIINGVPTATAYGEDGVILAELTREDSDTIDATSWGRTIVYDARNKLWLATDKVGGVTIYDKEGFVVDSYTVAANVSGGNIRPYSDGFVYVSTVNNGNITADWHSYSIHKPGYIEPLSSIKQNVIEINDSAIISYDDDASEYIAYIRRGVDLRDYDILEFGRGNAFVSMNCALILLRSSSGNNIIYDLRDGRSARLSTTSSRYAALSNDMLCAFGIGQVSNFYSIERIIPQISNIG